ncbi:hypothetical protein D3C85_1326390 [compost metagenome]
MVVVLAEAFKADLLAGQVRRRWADSRQLERAVHTLVAAVLLGAAQGNSLRQNAQPQPPDRQPGQAGAPLGNERRAVVRP